VVRFCKQSTVRSCCAALGREITRTIAKVQTDGDLPLPAAGWTVDQLAQAGRVFLGYALDDARTADGEMLDFFAAACPTPFESADPPLIHVVAGQDEYVPWEMLPLFEGSDSVHISDMPQLEAACRTFPGFAAVVERYHYAGTESIDYLSAWDRLPVRMIYHHRYQGAQAELGFFRACDQVVLEGPFPRDAKDGSAPSLARQLFDPRIGIDGAVRLYRDQVVHIACHCAAESSDDIDSYAFHFSDARDNGLVVRLRDLVGDLVRLWRDHRRSGNGALNTTHAAPMPMVFLNACGTAPLDPTRYLSFLKPFHEMRNPSIIATAGNIPDRIAAAFSRVFYSALLQGQTVGRALHSAKWRLLQDRGNPLGLMYSVHGSANLRILPVPMPSREPILRLEQP